MIQKINIRNVRCFKKLSIDGVRRFNIIVGDSGTEKTALL
jgi:AAA15 family ATPase/GTPase